MEVKVIKFDHLGNGISKIGEKVVFIKRALPNEIVDIVINKDNKKYQFATIKSIIKKSEKRIESICPYYDKCGGCDFLHTNDDTEEQFKINKGKELLDSNIEFYNTKTFNYRNKVVFHVKGNQVGFYKEKSNNIIDIDYCYLLDDSLNKVLDLLRNYVKNNKHNIKEVMIRTGNEIMMDVTGTVNNDFVNYFSFVDTIIVNNKVIKGKGYIDKQILDYKFKISPKSFFQVNYCGLEEIYHILKDNLKSDYNKALDLYSGTSVMGILISDFCKEVISVESNSSATNDALINIKNNNINNLKVINEKVENFIDKLRDSDLIIIDPPRSGLDKKTISYLEEIHSKNLVYISCDMITLKRDLETLKKYYDISKIYLVNMFPKTYHVECITILKRK